MNEFEYEAQDDMRLWLEVALDLKLASDLVCIGHKHEGDLIGVVGYDRHTEHSCMLHIASNGRRGWLNREFIIRAMAYPFNQCKYRRMSCLVSEHNEASLKFTNNFGWQIEGRVRKDGQNGEDLIMFGLLREECRFLPMAFH